MHQCWFCIEGIPVDRVVCRMRYIHSYLFGALYTACVAQICEWRACIAAHQQSQFILSCPLHDRKSERMRHTHTQRSATIWGDGVSIKCKRCRREWRAFNQIRSTVKTATATVFDMRLDRMGIASKTNRRKWNPEGGGRWVGRNDAIDVDHRDVRRV